jgi:hypothetical protein
VSFDAKGFYDLALWLVQQRNDEASLRTAISRTYYAAHLLAVQRLIQKGWEAKGTGDDHGRVLHELRRGRTRNLAGMLDRLREFREHADYHRQPSDSILGQQCKLCEQTRESPTTSEPVVKQSHWEEAKEVAERLFPLLDKL